MGADVSIVSLFKAELELCKIGPGDTVAVLSEGTLRADYAQAFLAAAQQIGAAAMQINLPSLPVQGPSGQFGRTPLAGNRLAIEALKQATIVIDLMGLLFSHEQLEITDAGARVLLVVEPLDVLREMFPTEELRRRVEYGSKLLGAARELRVTSPFGTDLHYKLGQYPVMTEYGYTDTPGRWDHFPSGFLLTHGNDGAVEGTVMLMPGDIVNAFRRYVQTPVRLRVEGGYVREIAGDGMDATLLKDYIESFNDPRAYAISHIGWGLNRRAKWHHMAATRELDAEIGVHGLAFYGNVLFSTGPNTELGGSNDTACHLDMPLRNCSLTLDGTLIVDHGRVVPPEMQTSEV